MTLQNISVEPQWTDHNGVTQAWAGDVEVIRRTLARVEALYQPLIADKPWDRPIIIRPDPRYGPCSWDAEGPGGARVITLEESRPDFHDRLSFQAGHELCHVSCNYFTFPSNKSNDHHWFEEALCGAAELVTLLKLGFGGYRACVVNDMHKAGELTPPFGPWYAKNRDELTAKTKGLVDLNRPLALHIANRFPNGEFISAARYLYDWSNPGTGTFQDHLDRWAQRCPARHKAVPEYLQQHFR